MNGPGIVAWADALDDQQWFADHPRRQYRLRPGWAVRRRGQGVLLRVPLSDQRAYSDEGEAIAEALWWRSAWPDLSPKERKALLKAARLRTKPLPIIAARESPPACPPGAQPGGKQ